MPYILNVELPLSYKQKYISHHDTHHVPLLPASILNSPAPMGESNESYASSASQNLTVAQALEIARDYHPEQTRDTRVVQILDTAVAQIWGKLQAAPQSYILTREEFAVFNFFQHRFEGEAIAVEARKRYWTSLSVPATS